MNLLSNSCLRLAPWSKQCSQNSARTRLVLHGLTVQESHPDSVAEPILVERAALSGMGACGDSPTGCHPVNSLTGMTGARDTLTHSETHAGFRERLREAEPGMEGEPGGRYASSVDRVTLTPGHQGPQKAPGRAKCPHRGRRENSRSDTGGAQAQRGTIRLNPGSIVSTHGGTCSTMCLSFQICSGGSNNLTESFEEKHKALLPGPIVSYYH